MRGRDECMSVGVRPRPLASAPAFSSLRVKLLWDFEQILPFPEALLPCYLR